MLCSTNTKFCDSVGVSVSCYENIYQGIDTNINITLSNVDKTPIDLDDVSEIDIKLYDVRNNVDYIADYVYPSITEFISSIWFENQPIEFNQLKIPNSGDEDIFIKKGEIMIIITSEISKYLMIGDIFIDIKFTYLEKIHIIKCFKILTFLTLVNLNG